MQKETKEKIFFEFRHHFRCLPHKKNKNRTFFFILSPKKFLNSKTLINFALLKKWYKNTAEH